jgi:antitoxin ParD1/3/4
MTTMNISLPDSLKQFVDQRVGEAYGSSSEYIRDLIRQDQVRQAEQQLVSLLREGLESGPSTPANQAFWDDLQRQIDQ